MKTKPDSEAASFAKDYFWNLLDAAKANIESDLREIDRLKSRTSDLIADYDYWVNVKNSLLSHVDFLMNEPTEVTRTEFLPSDRFFRCYNCNSIICMADEVDDFEYMINDYEGFTFCNQCIGKAQKGDILVRENDGTVTLK